jgi:hypothetical protein
VAFCQRGFNHFLFLAEQRATKCDCWTNDVGWFLLGPFREQGMDPICKKTLSEKRHKFWAFQLEQLMGMRVSQVANRDLPSKPLRWTLDGDRDRSVATKKRSIKILGRYESRRECFLAGNSLSRDSSWEATNQSIFPHHTGIPQNSEWAANLSRVPSRN